MQKIKIALSLLISSIFGLVFAAPAFAASVVQIQSLPGYINYTDFKLSCTTNGGSAQFYSKKDGGSYTAFGPAIDLTVNPCQVQVTGTQFGSEGKFWFEVIVDGTPSETSTTLDTTAPGGVSDFGKERMNAGTTYHVHWKNPLDTDFVKVFIYRGTEAGFSADDSHKVAEVGGNPGDTQSWDNGSLDPTKEYFYVIRALDHAGNSSGLVGDQGPTTTVTTNATPKPGISGNGQVTVLPNESGTGSVLGTAVSPSPKATLAPTEAQTPQTSTGGLLNWILGHKKTSLGVLIALLLGGYGLYYFQKRK